MRFTKMHGCGNDYVYVNGFEETVADPSAAAIRVADRHFGIGGDGLIMINPSDKADCEMAMYNADGSRGEMCGNGIRCVGKYAYDHGIVDRPDISIETLAGIKQLHMEVSEGRVTSATVNMGAPVQTSELDEPLSAGGMDVTFTGISMGNPHAVIFVEDPAALDLPLIGPSFENHPRFPDRTNTEFVKVLNRTHVRMRVWERGSGETLACGTGACAAAVACILHGYTEDTVTVHLLGGDLVIRWDRENNLVYMTGPATEVFQGEIEL